ncbi:MAG: efflux RND transporter periplasmic adaptor subunit [Tidjanibacter sp.]|nr:efflux RND transporter periplasmic adaptor subunit [Tidjanibacter sp.]
MKRLITIVAFLSASLYLSGCHSKGSAEHTHDHEHTEEVHDHSHEGHDHSEHDHAHAEEAHNHEGHDHSEHNHEGHDHSEHDHDGHDHAAGEIVFTKAQAAMTDFKVEPATKGFFRNTIKCSGVISAPRSQIQVITAPVSGIIHFSDARLTENTQVGKGKSLFTISSATISSGNEAAKAEAAFRKAEADRNRLKPLYDDHLISQGEWLAAEQEYQRALAEWEPYRGNSEGGTTLSAQIGGYITDLSVSEGDFVGVGTPIATVVGGGKKQLAVSVPQRYYSLLPTINDARFTTPVSEEQFTVSALGGSKKQSSTSVAAGSTLVEMLFEFPAGNFPDGTFAEVTLLGAERGGVLTLPLSAITESQGLYYVYVQLDEECYMRREVRIGDDDGLNVEIVAGVDPGEMVVTRGAVNVKMASFSGAIPHSHSH